MSNSNPQLKEYIREQLTNRILESVENISEALKLTGSSPAPRSPAPPTYGIRTRPFIPKELPHKQSIGLNVALTAALAGNQAIQSATDEWKQNKEKGMYDDENTNKTAFRALVSGGLEAAVAYALVSRGQQMVSMMPKSKKSKIWATPKMKGMGGAAGGALAAYLAGRGIDSQMDTLTNMTDNPDLIEFHKKTKANKEKAEQQKEDDADRKRIRDLTFPPQSSNNKNQQMIATDRKA